MVKEDYMKLYISTKRMIFEEDNIEHEIVLQIRDVEFFGYDEIVELPDDDKFIKDTLKIIYKKDDKGDDTKEIENKVFIVREQKTWWSFSLYEFKDDKITPFNYAKYNYFVNTDRRMALALKICNEYNLFSELKILRKTLKYIMDELNLNYPEDFSIMDKKIEEIIKKNPKDKSK